MSVQAGKYVTKDKSKTDNKITEDNPEKASNTKYSKAKLAWFSLASYNTKRGGLIVQCSPACTGRQFL